MQTEHPLVYHNDTHSVEVFRYNLRIQRERERERERGEREGKRKLTDWSVDNLLNYRRAVIFCGVQFSRISRIFGVKFIIVKFCV